MTGLRVGPVWTEERIAALKTMWGDGVTTGLTASQIAIELGGVTRNGVIGKVHRLGLAGRPRAGRMTGTPRKPKAPRPPVVRAAPASAPRPTPAPPKCDPIEFMALTNTTCRFPIGERLPYLFCGDPSAGLLGGMAYCSFHSRITYRHPGQAI